MAPFFCKLWEPVPRDWLKFSADCSASSLPVPIPAGGVAEPVPSPIPWIPTPLPDPRSCPKGVVRLKRQVANPVLTIAWPAKGYLSKARARCCIQAKAKPKHVQLPHRPILITEPQVLAGSNRRPRRADSPKTRD